MNSEEKFDAVIVEIFAIDALFGLGQHFNCPVIGVTTFDAVYWNNVHTGNQSPYSYIPMAFAGLNDRMTFTERLINTIYSLGEKLLYNFLHLRQHRKLYQKYFPKASTSFDDVHKSLSIVFMNSHIGTSSARPFLPNMIEIGGIHIQPAKPLQSDIQEFWTRLSMERFCSRWDRSFRALIGRPSNAKLLSTRLRSLSKRFCGNTRTKRCLGTPATSKSARGSLNATFSHIRTLKFSSHMAGVWEPARDCGKASHSSGFRFSEIKC